MLEASFKRMLYESGVLVTDKDDPTSRRRRTPERMLRDSQEMELPPSQNVRKRAIEQEK